MNIFYLKVYLNYNLIIKLIIRVKFRSDPIKQNKTLQYLRDHFCHFPKDFQLKRGQLLSFFDKFI